MSKYVCTSVCQCGGRLWRVGQVTDDDKMALKRKDFFTRLRSTKQERIEEEVAELIPEVAEMKNYHKPTLTRAELRHALPPMNDIEQMK